MTTEHIEVAETIRELRAQVDALTAERDQYLALFNGSKDEYHSCRIERDAMKQQAQQWKMEAETHKSTVNECYQACTGSTGEPGNWNGANPVRELVKERDSALKFAADRLMDSERLDWLETQCQGYGFEGEHEGNRWVVDGPYRTVRIGIDDGMAAS